MSFRNQLRPIFLRLLIATVISGTVTGIARTDTLLSTPHESEDTQSRLQVVLLNGGGTPASNYYSHLLHIKKLIAVLRRAGVPTSNITIFNADGAEPAADFAVRDPQEASSFWLIAGTRLEQPLRPQIRYENSTVDGFPLRPATKAALRDWFDHADQHLHSGDTLLFYVTDHGTKNPEDLTNNRITLWGKDETLSVIELRELFAHLPAGTRVVALMSQCYSGSFAHLMYAGTLEDLPTGNVCGVFSATADRQAYGCYPENRDKDNVGHSFAFVEHLAAGYSFPEAHTGVLVTDQTPDVPLKTSEVYLAQLLEKEASARGQKIEALIDELLSQAWLDKSAWEPEIRLLDRIAQAFGYFSPRSVTELQEQAQRLPDLSQQFSTYGDAWEAALHALTSENFKRFLTDKTDWQHRLDQKAVSTLTMAERQTLTASLLLHLADFTRMDTATSARLRFLREKVDSASKAHYRMQVRLAVVLRMRTILTTIAGRVYLARSEKPHQRQAYTRLTTCEAVDFNDSQETTTPPAPLEAFPLYDEERKLADTVLPAWLGIRFQPTSQTLRGKLDLQAGATTVQTVYPDSPAQKAGIAAGDIVLGPPDAPFTETHQIREWVMTAPIGTPTTLEVLRDQQPLRLTLTPQRYPLKWPSLPGPPKIGSNMLPLQNLTPYRGTVPVGLGHGGPYLLFFWATWCKPCKASLPEVVAFEQEKSIPVIAITDEPAEQLDMFFSGYSGPFPAIVALDNRRQSFLTYGVNGTPTFVLAYTNNKVRTVATGYQPEKGLPLAGWSWAKRSAPTTPQAQP
ncbi:MAG: PDZ domain-containing protein [Candidatus Binatia bacterium]